jgi:phage-related tail fiber protein
VLSGTAVLVNEGTTNADTQWQLTTNDPITLASTSLTFELYPPVSAAKNPVRAATTGNITLSGAQTIDGVSVIAGDRVLVKNQTAGEENGIYVAAAGAWSRSADANSALKLLPASMVPVSEGTANANSVWWLTTAAPITLGSTSLTFGQFIYSFGSDTAMIFEYAVAAKVPTGGTRYFNSDGVPTNAPAQRIIRACRITGASIQVSAVDASRAYKLSILKNGVEAASVALSTSTLGNHSAALNVALVAGDLLSVALVRTSGTGISTFNAARGDRRRIETVRKFAQDRCKLLQHATSFRILIAWIPFSGG